MTEFGPPEHVHVENDWWDGPRAGIADIQGQPHRFVSQFDKDEDDWSEIFLVWPIDEEELALEQEQWRIFVRWHDAFEAGLAGTSTHPNQPGTDARWDEIQALLQTRRTHVPATARRAMARSARVERVARNAADGPRYRLAWRLL